MPIPSWHINGLCREYDPDVFFEPEWEDFAASVCLLCPVKDKCLTWAIETKQQYGVWGGLTESQRRKTHTKRKRVKCPGCGSESVESLRNRHEGCLACGLTWPI